MEQELMRNNSAFNFRVPEHLKHRFTGWTKAKGNKDNK
jgi:hypothetical protein